MNKAKKLVRSVWYSGKSKKGKKAKQEVAAAADNEEEEPVVEVGNDLQTPPSLYF